MVMSLVVLWARGHGWCMVYRPTPRAGGGVYFYTSLVRQG